MTQERSGARCSPVRPQVSCVGSIINYTPSPQGVSPKPAAVTWKPVRDAESRPHPTPAEHALAVARHPGALGASYSFGSAVLNPALVSQTIETVQPPPHGIGTGHVHCIFITNPQKQQRSLKDLESPVGPFGLRLYLLSERMESTPQSRCYKHPSVVTGEKGSWLTWPSLQAGRGHHSGWW